MHEHAGEDGVHLLRRIGRKSTRDKGPLLDEGLPGVKLDEKHQNIQGNQRSGYNRKAAPLRIVVAERKHRLPQFFLISTPGALNTVLCSASQ